jgi:hypothetical protein
MQRVPALVFLLLIVVAVGSTAILAYYGLFYETGRQWNEACWAKRAAEKAKDKAANAAAAKGIELRPDDFGDPQGANAQQDAQWRLCELMSRRAIYQAGFIFAGNPEVDRNASTVVQSCPSSWTQVPMAGTYWLTLDLIADQGGTHTLDAFIPAETTIQRAWIKQWPECAAERIRLGYPMIVEKKRGEFDWAEPCIPCEAARKK